MRKIMILGSALHIGGAERVIANLAKHIDASRFQLTIAHLKERGAVGEELAAKGFDVVGVPRAAGGLGRYFSFRSLASIVRSRGIELIHTHTTYAMTDASLCRLLSNPRLKLVHTFHFGNYPHYPPRYRMLEYVWSRVVNRLISVGVEQGKVLRSTYSLPAARVETIVNGVEQPSQAPDEKWRSSLGEGRNLIIGTICVCSEQKGLADLLSVARMVCAKYDHVRFVVVGSGPLRVDMERRCKDMGLEECVTFTGWKDNAGATMMPLFDIFFQPSLWEAMSMVVLEAMAVAKPVVVTDVGDNRHVVVDGYTGLVVQRGDHGAMASSLAKLIESRELRDSFGHNGLERFEALYDAVSMAREYERVYEQTLASG